MKYVLTGHSGMLASVLDKELKANNFQRVSASEYKNINQIKNWISPSSGRVEPDFRDPIFMKFLYSEDWDVLFHAGALVGTTRCEEHSRNIWSCNVEASVRLAEVVKRRGKQMVYFASDSEFDPADYGYDKPIKVNKTIANPHSRYGMSKLSARLLVENIIDPLDLLIIYPCFGFGGAMDGNSCIAEMLKCAANIYKRRPFLPLDPNSFKEVTSHAHIARAIVAAFKFGIRGKIAAASGLRMKYGDIVDLIRFITAKDLKPQWHSELDYKMDLIYDKDDVNYINSIIKNPPISLESEIRLEWNKLLNTPLTDLAEHEWKHTKSLRRNVLR